MDYLEPMTAAVRAAANIYRSAKNDLHIEVKGEDKNNLVTAYDKQIQDFLYKELSAAFPGCAFLGEEGGGKIEVPMGLCIIIEPIDGTTNFIRNFEHSAISVGLAVDRKMVAGVVYDVDKDNLYAAQRGCGATLNGRVIHVNDSDLDHSLLLFGSCPYERELAHRTFQMVEKAYSRVLEIRRTGSAALDICYVASGKADLYFELILRPWDYAAAIVIVEEAGGVICTTENQPMPIDQIVGVRCGNDENLAEFDALVQNL